ncbi:MULTISPECIES: TRAP transporter large permease [unclassified Bradyrhizobium]
MTPFIVLALLFGLLALGTPVGFAMAFSGSVGLVMVGGWGTLFGILQTAPLSTVSSYELITIPMFLLMADLVLLSGVADDLFKTASAWVGRIPGGLGMATALAGAGFGAICGTSTASAATLSSTSLPAMIRQGYEPKMAAGVVAISGTLSMLLPTSVALVIFGLLAEVNIGKLLISGIIPAILVTITIMATIYFLVWQDPSRAPAAKSVPWREKFSLLWQVSPMVVLFSIVTGTIYLGVATPTEASAFGAFGAFLLAIVKGKITPSSLYRTLLRACHGTCMIIMILVGASIFGYFFTLTHVTQDLVAWIGSLPASRWVIITLILCGYIVLGSFMDQIAILVLTVPIVLPLIKTLGFDPIWFGVIKIVTAEVGMITPPVGLNCFIVARYAKRPVAEVFHGTFPHFIAHLIVIAILVAFPSIILWLPSQMGR